MGANCEIWHGRLFISATAPIGGITLVAMYSAWVAETEDIRNLPLLPFWVSPLWTVGANWEIWKARHHRGSEVVQLSRWSRTLHPTSADVGVGADGLLFDSVENRLHYSALLFIWHSDRGHDPEVTSSAKQCCSKTTRRQAAATWATLVAGRAEFCLQGGGGDVYGHVVNPACV